MFLCEQCKQQFQNITQLSSHLSHPKSKCKTNIKEYYDKYLRKQNEGICIYCGVETLFYSLIKGYPNNKCKHCRNKGENTQKLRQETFDKNKENKKILSGYYEYKEECQICKEKFKTRQGLSKHLSQKHLEISMKEYYDKYFKKEDEGVCLVTGKNTNFKNLVEGYYKYVGKGTNSEDDNIKEIKKTTLMKHYGVSNPLHSIIIREKVKRTNALKLQKKIIETQHNFLLEIINIKSIINKFQILKAKCLQCNTLFNTKWANLQYYDRGKCPICFPILSGSSKGEKELQDYIISIIPKNEKILLNDRTTIINQNTNYYLELDIYLPERKIAFEFNGLYWHSELNKSNPMSYHLDKYNYCKNLGIELIQIFEDEWSFKRNIVEDMIKFKLSMFKNRLFARNCSISIIDSKLKNCFLNENHIQGQDGAIVKLGLYHEKILVAVMTFSHGNISKGMSSKDKTIWELSRYATKKDLQIIGGAGKLLKYFQRNYIWKEIYTYADLRYSQGKLYKALNFVLSHQTQPNYWYSDLSICRIHRFNLRKRPDEPKDIPEWKLRQDQGYYRIWDCGNLKFQMINENFN